MNPASLSPSLRPPAISGLAASSLVALGFPVGAWAQTMFPVDQLMAPGPLPDIALGAAAAPVTIIEYASMTC